VVGLLMAIATLMTLRLDRQAGMAVSHRR